MTTINYVKHREAQQFFGVNGHTLRKWADTGKVDAIRSPNNQRLYNLNSGPWKKLEVVRKNIIYARVSSTKQKDDLERQTACLLSFYPDYEVITDIGSGINFKRPGLLSILQQSQQGRVQRVVVASRDRLCRFAFELIDWILRENSTELIVHFEKDQSEEHEHELSDDLLSIVQVFCCRRNGRRRYKQSQNAESSDISNVGTKETA